MIKVDYVFLCATYNRMSNIPFSIEVLCEAIVNRNEDAILLVIDNNSSDGTIEILKTLQKKYKMLEVVSSSDDLYWAQSMRLGFDYCKNNYNYSFLVPFNDDIDLKNSDLNMLFTKPATAEVHSFKDISGKHSYGGYKSRFIFTDLYQVAVKPNRTHQIIDTCNMNMVVIPFSYIKKV